MSDNCTLKRAVAEVVSPLVTLIYRQSCHLPPQDYWQHWLPLVRLLAAIDLVSFDELASAVLTEESMGRDTSLLFMPPNHPYGSRMTDPAIK